MDNAFFDEYGFLRWWVIGAIIAAAIIGIIILVNQSTANDRTDCDSFASQSGHATKFTQGFSRNQCLVFVNDKWIDRENLKDIQLLDKETK